MKQPGSLLWIAGLVGLALSCDRAARKATSARFGDDPAARIPGAIVVDFEDGTTQEQIDAWEKDWGVDLRFNSIEGPQDGIAVAAGVFDVESALSKIRSNPHVEAAEVEESYQATFAPNDPQFPEQWNLSAIGMQKAWEVSRGKGVIVAVLDTGIAYEDYGEFRQVPDLKGTKFVKGYDFVHKTWHPNDDHGHGTHVAGTIAQATNNREGVAGVAFEAELMPVKVLNHFGSGNSADISDAIRFAVDHGAKVLNLSLGGGGYSQVMANAVAYARKKGAVVVCAAGNTGRGRVQYPAAYPGALAVAATGPEGERAPYSSYGKELDLSAPGGDKKRGERFGILQNTIDPKDPQRSIYAFYQGTSMAAPHVAGVAALLFAAGARSPDEVEAALFSGAKRIGGQEWSEGYGHGILDAPGALAALGASPLELGPLLWAALLLLVVLLTLRPRSRPGYLNLLVRPAFLLPLLLSTVGAFFAKSVIRNVSMPLPSPIVYSALIPFVLSALAIRNRALRPVIAGLSVGFAGFLAYGLWIGSPVAYLPLPLLAVPWLLANALACLFIARAMIRKEGAL